MLYKGYVVRNGTSISPILNLHGPSTPPPPPPPNHSRPFASRRNTHRLPFRAPAPASEQALLSSQRSTWSDLQQRLQSAETAPSVSAQVLVSAGGTRGLDRASSVALTAATLSRHAIDGVLSALQACGDELASLAAVIGSPVESGLERVGTLAQGLQPQAAAPPPAPAAPVTAVEPKSAPRQIAKASTSAAPPAKGQKAQATAASAPAPAPAAAPVPSTSGKSIVDSLPQIPLNVAAVVQKVTPTALTGLLVLLVGPVALSLLRSYLRSRRAAAQEVRRREAEDKAERLQSQKLRMQAALISNRVADRRISPEDAERLKAEAASFWEEEDPAGPVDATREPAPLPQVDQRDLQRFRKFLGGAKIDTDKVWDYSDMKKDRYSN